MAYIGFGSNLGNREQNLHTARALINQHPQMSVTRVSQLYFTEPLLPHGDHPQPWYLNAVFEVRTDLAPHDLLTALKNIENLMGRNPDKQWKPRLCDLDILLYETLTHTDTRLKIPHPHIARRRFVLKPLCDLIPLYIHPKLHQTLADLLHHVDDPLEIMPWHTQSKSLAPCS